MYSKIHYFCWMLKRRRRRRRKAQVSQRKTRRSHLEFSEEVVGKRATQDNWLTQWTTDHTHCNPLLTSWKSTSHKYQQEIILLFCLAAVCPICVCFKDLQTVSLSASEQSESHWSVCVFLTLKPSKRCRQGGKETVSEEVGSQWPPWRWQTCGLTQRLLNKCRKLTSIYSYGKEILR